MTVEELCKRLQIINNDYGEDEEVCHIRMDKVFLEYINDRKVKRLFGKVAKWYA